MNISDKLENYSNFNHKKRLQLIESYNQSATFTTNTTTDSANLDLLALFDAYVTTQKHYHFSQLQNEDHLIDIIIQYSLLYLEEFNYDLKIKGLNSLDHLICHSTQAQINFNMRSQLIYTCLERYIIDKEFLDRALKTMRQLLNVIETKSKCSEHSYRKHSVVIEVLLDNCYMTTNSLVKLVYYTSFVDYLRQIGPYSVRHLGETEQLFKFIFI